VHGQKSIKLEGILEENADDALAAPKINKPTESCRKLHIEYFQDRYCWSIHFSFDHISSHQMGGSCGLHGTACRIVVRKLEEDTILKI
jgi:hypothetical protein